MSRSDAEKEADAYPILKDMLEEGYPLTRETYILLDMGEMPEEWTAENEMMLPSVFRQHW